MTMHVHIWALHFRDLLSQHKTRTANKAQCLLSFHMAPCQTKASVHSIYTAATADQHIETDTVAVVHQTHIPLKSGRREPTFAVDISGNVPVRLADRPGAMSENVIWDVSCMTITTWFSKNSSTS